MAFRFSALHRPTEDVWKQGRVHCFLDNKNLLYAQYCTVHTYVLSITKRSSSPIRRANNLHLPCPVVESIRSYQPQNHPTTFLRSLDMPTKARLERLRVRNYPVSQTATTDISATLISQDMNRGQRQVGAATVSSPSLTLPEHVVNLVFAALVARRSQALGKVPWNATRMGFDQPSSTCWRSNNGQQINEAPLDVLVKESRKPTALCGATGTGTLCGVCSNGRH